MKAVLRLTVIMILSLGALPAFGQVIQDEWKIVGTWYVPYGDAKLNVTTFRADMSCELALPFLGVGVGTYEIYPERGLLRLATDLALAPVVIYRYEFLDDNHMLVRNAGGKTDVYVREKS